MDVARVAAELGLAEHHFKILHEESGISVEIIKTRGYWSAMPGDEEKVVALGFARKQFMLPAIVIPLWNVRGEIESHALRMDDPGDLGKYTRPRGAPNIIDVNPYITREDLRRPGVWHLGEGAKKCDAIISKGARALNISGVFNWRGRNEWGQSTVLPDWEEIALAGNTLIIDFDSDMATNPLVRKGLDRLVGFLRSRQASVQITLFPVSEGGRKIGADDYLRDHTLSEMEDLTISADDFLRDDPLLKPGFSDLDTAARFAEVNSGRAAWDSVAGAWLCWDGARWDTSPSLQIERWAIETAAIMHDRAESMSASDIMKGPLLEYAAGLRYNAKLEAMVRWARPMLEAKHDSLDQDPWLLNCLNGTVDLRTGKLRAHDPGDMITRVCPVHYDPEARYEEWERFVRALCEGKEGLADFLRQCVGYSISGMTVEEKLFMAIGPTRTGKSTFIHAVKSALGDYAKTADFSTFILGKGGAGGNEPTEALARLAGSRLVSSVEVEDGKALAQALVKQITGNDVIAARFMYRGIFEYMPTMKLWLVANHEPRVDKDDDATWERIYRLPFTNYVPPEKRDAGLKIRLSDPRISGAGVLAWAVRGCLEWQAVGRLRAPACVEAETAAYRERMDPLSDFIAERCFVNEKASIGVTELLQAYARWSQDVGERYPLGRNKFARAMEGLGFRREFSGDAKVNLWRGVTVLIGPDGTSGRKSKFADMTND